MRNRIWAVAALALIGAAGIGFAAPIAWQAVRNVAGDADVVVNGTVVKAFTFASGNAPTVNGVAFQPFNAQAADLQTFGVGFKAYYNNPSLSAAYNQLLAGGIQDATHLDAPAAQRLTLNGLTPGRKYQIQIWVADNRSWRGLKPAYSSSAQTIQGASADINMPTLQWEGGDTSPTAQFAIGVFTADKSRQTLTFTPTAGFFNGKKWYSAQINALLLQDLSPGAPPPAMAKRAALASSAAAALTAAPTTVVKSLDDCNVVWDSPSVDSFGSMPLGNGDIGLNVWVEENGDLLFYISKVDAYDAGHLLPKLGRVRLQMNPAMSVEPFKQTLVLRDGAIAIQGGDVNLKVWVDANSPVIRVEGESATPRQAEISLEPLRALTNAADAAQAKLPGNGTAGILLDDKADRLAWCYRNMSSAWSDHLRSQNSPEMVAKAVDPILHRASGCLLQGAGFARQDANTLTLKTPSKRFDCSIQVLSCRAESLPDWFAQIEKPARSDWEAHRQWWQAFWDRSYILVSRCGAGPVQLDQYRFEQFPQASLAYRGHKEIGAAENAFQLTQRYALERFAEACAGRGAVPPQYNGSIFTMDMPAGAMGFDRPKLNPVSPDGRDWANLSFMWQNTRHPYWAMAARGDYDTLLPGLRFVRDGLDICRDRCRKIFKHDGAFIMEASWWHNVGVFNWDRVPGHLRYHFLASIEMPAIMCEYYEHTQDRKFLDEILLPCADEFIKFYELQFPKRDARGKMLMEPAATVETYQPVTNPNTEITGLRYLLSKLLGFDIGDARKAQWTKLLNELPDVPLRSIKGLDLLAVGDKYAAGRQICESPEMYSVYPFRQAWLGRTGGGDALLSCARQSFHLRTISLDGTVDSQPVETGGWQATPLQAAYLGLAREAARLTSINFNDQFIHWTGNVDPNAPWPSRPRARFAAFWETKMDGTPDNDHGANSVNALQSMLLQSDGKKIFLLPAWPEDWDVSFKLHANYQTTVECVYRDGKTQSLKVAPASRQGDIVDMSTLENRIRTLVGVACCDRNYLFGLPPMLDGLPTTTGKTTAPWLAKYGESLAGVRAAPWPGCVFRDNIMYVHILDGPIEPPSIPAKLLSSKYLTEKNEKPDAILKLEYDRPIEEFALAAPSQGSLTAGKKLTNGEIDLGQPVTFDRVEFTIENTGYRRGQGRKFALQVKQADGSWQTVCQGAVYGSIFSKKIEPVTAQYVKLNITASAVRQFDLFPARR
ncbi:MAG: DUF5703 domain-containing protein [Candidatus Sumerlaeota bacterium]|nr:DUF5703 domain-containing protein [Candidatus Sumerlaeota bacterium]